MKKALAIGLAAAMTVSMSASVYAGEEGGAGVAKEDLKVGIIYIGDENEGYTAAHMKGIDEMQEELGLDDSQIIEKRSEERRVGKECRSRWSPYH